MFLGSIASKSMVSRPMTLGVLALGAMVPSVLAATAAVNPALADLKDIIAPDPIGHWPWAIGYWLVLTSVIVILIAVLVWLRKRAKYLAPKKAAKQLFVKLDRQSANYPFEVNNLLKRTALSYLPREAIAKLDGRAWADWLDAQLAEDQRGRIGPLLDKRHQGCPLTSDEAAQLHRLAHAWFSAKTPLSAPVKSAQTRQTFPATQRRAPEAQC